MKPPLIKLVWADAMAIGEWKSIEELTKEHAKDAAPCTTVGFLIKKTREWYYVASTITDGETTEEIMSNGIMMIPRKWVLSKVELELGEDNADH